MALLSSTRIRPAALGAILALLTLASAHGEPRPPYKDPAQPVSVRVEDLLGRMTLDEEVAQMQGVWENKGAIQTPDETFSADKATAAFPSGLGQISRPSDRRGVTPAPGAPAPVNRDARETADYTNAAQHWAVEKTRLGIPLLFHDEGLHGYVARGATSFPQAIGLASTWDPDLSVKVFSVAARAT